MIMCPRIEANCGGYGKQSAIDEQKHQKVGGAYTLVVNTESQYQY